MVIFFPLQLLLPGDLAVVLQLGAQWVISLESSNPHVSNNSLNSILWFCVNEGKFALQLQRQSKRCRPFALFLQSVLANENAFKKLYTNNVDMLHIFAKIFKTNLKNMKSILCLTRKILQVVYVYYMEIWPICEFSMAKRLVLCKPLFVFMCHMCVFVYLQCAVGTHGGWQASDFIGW